MANCNTELNLTLCEKQGSKYINKWNEWPHGFLKGVPKFIKWIISKAFQSAPTAKELDQNLPIYIPYFVKCLDKYNEDKSNIKATWFGHASVLLELEGFRILCDPIFSDKCGPVLGFTRYRKPPCSIKDLPKIDAVVISHNHYDHMDYDSINQLSKLWPNITWLIPDGDMSNIKDMVVGKPHIIEMRWWDEYELTDTDNNKLVIAFTPTQHWSNRSIFDLFKSLWGSWAFIGSEQRFWFGGDTGYCGAFREIGEKYGPFDAAAIPIGAYEPRDLLKFQHANPEDATNIHKDIKSKLSFGIHWGTFSLSEEDYMDPKYTLIKIVNDLQEKIDFFTISHGETLIVNKDGHKIESSNETLLEATSKTPDIDDTK